MSPRMWPRLAARREQIVHGGRQNSDKRMRWEVKMSSVLGREDDHLISKQMEAGAEHQTMRPSSGNDSSLG